MLLLHGNVAVEKLGTRLVLAVELCDFVREMLAHFAHVEHGVCKVLHVHLQPANDSL